MGAFVDLTGKKFGKLTVASKHSRAKNGAWKWLCKCDCGNETIVLNSSLTKGVTVSCGCHNRESKRRFNEYYTFGDVTFIKDRKFNIYGILDTEDLDKVKEYCWHVNSDGYFVTKISNKELAMHRLVINCPDNLQVDHIHQVKHGVCDNRKKNLRTCTKLENLRNKTIYKNSPLGISGISKTKSGKYSSRISLYGEDIGLGTFETLEQAIQARKQAEVKYWGRYYG